jgi:hypothetical protein
MKKDEQEIGLRQNAYQVGDTIIVSRNVHDYVEHNGFAIDGGLEYQRLIGDRGRTDLTDLTIYAKDKVEDYADKVVWGTRGKNGDEKFRWVLLKNCSEEHLLGILKTQEKAAEYVRRAVCYILHRRVMAAIGGGYMSFYNNRELAERAVTSILL